MKQVLTFVFVALMLYGCARGRTVDKECEETWAEAKAKAAREQDPTRRKQMEEIIAKVPEFRAGCRG